MRLEFQKEILQFLTQAKDGKKYIKVLDSDIFDLAEYITVFELLKDYVEQYGGLPSKGGVLQFLDDQLRNRRDKASPEIVKLIEDTISVAFTPLQANHQQLRERLVGEYQLKLTKQMFRETAGDLANAMKTGDTSVISSLYTQIRNIKQLGDNDLDEQEKNRGTFLISEHNALDLDVVRGAPTSFKALNAMTSAGGFHPPQLIILASEPKGFKTGTAINIIRGYIRDGYRVYYADAENGHRSIKQRVRQSILECTSGELRSGVEDDNLGRLIKRYSALGGEFRCDHYPAHTKTMDDVDAELDYLKEEYDWEPQIIVYDYLDLFVPIDSKIKEKRLKIQATYFDAIRLQNKRDMFGFTLSQVSKEAVNAKVIDMKLLAEDFGKAANCHAAFAICSDEIEKKAGLRRIIPIVQREGVAQHSARACFVKVDEAINLMTEIDFAAWSLAYSEAEEKFKQDTGKKKIRRKFNKNKTLKDE